MGSVVLGATNIWVEMAFKRLGWMEREREEDPAEIESPGPVLRILLALGLVFGVLFSLSFASQVVLAISTLTGSLVIIGVVGLIVVLTVSLFIAWLVAEGLELRRRVLFSGITCAATSGMAVIATVLLVLRPPDFALTPGNPGAEVRYWTLPTGSHIAYVHYPAQDQPWQAPIVYLHDGPGLAVLEHDRSFYSQFAQDGFDVYLYDQVGTGWSDQLESIEEYSIQRDIRDLDAIREALGANRLILIGQGAGAHLAARYLSRYPERVEKVVFHSPTPMWDGDRFFYDYARTGSLLGDLTLVAPRYIVAKAIATYGPGAAEKIVSQDEMGIWSRQSYDPRSLVCARHADLAPQIDDASFNDYVRLRTTLTVRDLADPHPQLRDNLTPALILASECDYVPWQVTLQYADALLNDRVVYIPDSGHAISLTQAETMAEVLRAFLLDQALPVEPYADRADPRPVLPR